ncbi:MAG: hypothetical protein IT236_00710 [Bacteroidia bacterium]|nr:hypothetical protein [Bacteroidia bacterium]
MRGKIIKVFTLLLFIGLINGFVMYRTGWLTEVVLPNPNSGSVNSNQGLKNVLGDTMEVVPSLPSSKSIVLRRKAPKRDTVARFKIDTSKIVDDRMGSSKSAIIFKPVKIDTSKISTKKK